MAASEVITEDCMSFCKTMPSTQELYTIVKQDTEKRSIDKKSCLLSTERLGTAECSSTETKSSAPNEADLAVTISALMSEDRTKVLRAITQLNTLCSTNLYVTAVAQITQSGGVKRLVELLGRNGDHELQFEATRMLKVMASSNPVHAQFFLECDAAPALIRLLVSTYATHQKTGKALEGCDMHYENLRSDTPRESILPSEEHPQHTLEQRLIISTLSCLSLLSESILSDKSEVYSVLINLMVQHKDKDVLAQVCSTLRKFLKTERYRLLFSREITQSLVDLLEHEFQPVVESALCVVNKILSGDDSLIEMLLHCSLLSRLLHLLLHHADLHAEICSVLAYTAKSETHIEALIEGDIFHLLANILIKGGDKARLEAICVVQGATAESSLEQTVAIVNSGCMEPLGDLLESSNDEMIHVVLCTISNILWAGEELAGDGDNLYAMDVEDRHWLGTIYSLQDHECEEVSSRAIAIISLFFKPTEDTPEMDTD